MKIKFVCTGTCCEDHPRHDHCRECSHANFKATVPYKRGKCDVWFNMLHGPDFVHGGQRIDPGNNSKLWKVAHEIATFGRRNCEYWMKRDQKKKGGEK